MPDTNSETAVFNQATTINPTLSSDTVIQALQFNSGSGSYIVGGGAARTLTLDRNSTTAGLVLDNQSGVVQTFDVNVLVTNAQTTTVNQTATPQIDAGAGIVIAAGRSFQMNRTFQQIGGTLTVNGTYSPAVASPTFFHELYNGSTFNLNSTVGTNRPVVWFKAGEDATINIGASQTSGYQLMKDFGGGGSGNATQNIYLRANGMTMTDWMTFASNSAGHVVANLGVRIAGSGNATISSAGTLSVMAPTGTGTAEFNLEADDGDVLNISTPLAGANIRVVIGKTGNGTVRLASNASNAYSSAALFDVKSGELVLDGTSISTSITGNLSIREGATVRLAKADKIANSSDMLLDGGNLNLNGLSEELSDLTLSDGTTSGLDFGSGTSVARFASFSAGTGILEVVNWTPGSDSLRFTADPTAFLSNILVNGAGAAVVNQTTYFEVIPEPAIFGLCVVGWVLTGFSASRKRSARRV